MEKKYRYAPLSGGYMAISMMGFLASVFFVYKLSPGWGVAFAIAFGAMFLASIGSMTRADPDAFVAVETKNKKK